MMSDQHPTYAHTVNQDEIQHTSLAPLSAGQEEWYRRLLSDIEPVVLPQQLSNPVAESQINQLSCSISESTWTQVQTVSESLASDVNTLCLACWQMLLTRYTQTTDLAIAIDDRIAGMSVDVDPSSTVLRQLVTSANNFREWVTQTTDSLRTLNRQSARSIQDLQILLNDETLYADPAHFHTLFHLNNYANLNLQSHSLTLSVVSSRSSEAEIVLHYQTNLFETENLNHLLDHYRQLLDQAVNNIDTPVDQFALLNDSEFNQVVHEFNDRTLPYSPDKGLVELFEEQALRCPDQIAVACADSSLSYRELSEQVSKMATWLLQFNLQADDLVSVCLPRNTKLLITQLAVQKVGAAYLPIDPRYPQDRIDYILNDASAKLFITDSSFQIDNYKMNSEQFLLDQVWPQIQATTIKDIESSVTPDHLAYVIYTSGSTGKPKGVEITRKNLVNQLTAAHHVPPVDENDVFIAITTVAFDISIVELFLPLIIGAKVYIASSDTVSDGFKLKALLQQEKITRLDTTPSTFRLLLEAGWEGDTSLIGQVGGEALSVDLAKSLIPKLKSFWNSYGPTEATVSCTAAQITDANKPVTIGTPLPNYRIYILEPSGQPCPINIPGEICVSGDSTGRGYLGREDLTNEKFADDPFLADGTRMYRTGDIGRWLSDGTIDCIGRMDSQIKLRGYRIELGEIETLIVAHPNVNHAALTLHKRNETEFLAAFLVLNDNTTDHTNVLNSIEENLREALPPYMIPSSFTIIDAIPVTPNGKLDHKALPEPSIRKANADIEAQLLTDTEKQIAATWCELIGVPRIDRDDNFFELGGHSLLAMKFINSANETFDQTITSRSLVTSSLAEIAQVLNPNDKAKVETTTPVVTNQAIPFFHTSADQRLFACFHGADNKSESPPILICQPLGHEYQRLHRSVRVLADHLASAGRQVLRFDYSGTGDSEGKLTDQSLKIWQQNIQDMVEWLSQQTQSNTVDAIGVRMGGLLLCSSTTVRLNKVVLWDSVINGKHWLDTLDQMTKSAMRNLDRFPVKQWQKDSHEFFGYSYSTNQVDELSALKLEEFIATRQAETHCVDSDPSTFVHADLPPHLLSIHHIDDNQRWSDFVCADDIAITPKSSSHIVELFRG